MICAVDSCERTARPGWSMCQSDITRMLSTAFGPRPIEVEPVERLSLTQLPPTPRAGAGARTPLPPSPAPAQAAGLQVPRSAA